MHRNRTRYYVVGLSVGLAVAALFAFGPKTTAEQQVARDIAILVTEPWDSVRVTSIDFQGPSAQPTDALVRGVRPNGTPVLVHFAGDTPYTAPTAIRRLQGGEYVGLDAEILMVPRSLVLSKFRKRFDRNATHAGIAFYAATPEPEMGTGAIGGETQPPHGERTDG
jgi:hypothetical protein